MGGFRWIGFRRWFGLTISLFGLIVLALAATGALGDTTWWRGFLADLLANGLIAVLIGLFGWWLFVRWQESIKAEQRRQEALILLRDELSENNNKKQIEDLCNQLRQYRGRTPRRFAFKTAVGDVLLDSGLLRGCDLSLQKGIHELYMRMREANWLLRWVYQQSLDEMTKTGRFLVPEELHDWPAIEILPLVEQVGKQLDHMLGVVRRALAEESGGTPS